ncbi:vacuolar protein sorting-associated protein 41 homolog [Solanum dulcamara]|uniref:vacuolar protein sorting-associated protein 41 homolog n=1 Tax=Solanum dulcamara TaxID=45834 RepID=UPI0024854CC7|nr:vacuolar protein sorting-associated protein 41 homolog [Solanum dulcamara]XP_055830071.1 vacuolar protein sorting-associated protein 41 homolog [Solanum dulcamara]XP_055830072.1 vacuolar protein sorting-associated protein 41 homolog [Solanum dulcamara]
MSPKPSENGIDGDDERDDEEEEDSEEEEEEEEEEDEPRLKYQRMGASVPSLLSADAATSIAVSERMIAFGTHGGAVHILDFLGNQVKEFAPHTASVNDLCFDTEGEYVGSCSDDGSVVINSLFTDEKMKFEYHRPMKAIALDPDYARTSSRRFVTGGLPGQLYLNVKKWLGYRDQVLHSGEGPIHAVKWRTSLVAWANDTGVKVYDACNDQRITFIERPRGIPLPELLLPHIVWQDDSLLVIGWGTSVKIALIRTTQSKGVNGTYKHMPMSGLNQVDIVASFQTSYFISGIAPFGDSLVILAYIPGEEDGEKDSSSTIPSRQGNAQRPEVRVVTWNNDELATDALPVHGFEHYKAKDYSLAHAPFSGSSYAGGQWAAGDEPLYYIVSPKDVVIAKPRDAEDHINWLLQHGWHEKALEAVEANQGQSELLDEVGSRYLDHLIVERKYAEAASLCPKLLRGSASAWERWVFHFAHLRQLPVLVPYIPTENPRLRDTAYEVALVALATNPSFHKDLLSTVKSWPPHIYSTKPVFSAIEPQFNTSSMTDPLKEALAELYVIDGQHDKAFALYADLMKPDLFEFIEKHNLHDAVREKVVQLMMISCKRAVLLLIQQRDLIPSSEVVSQLIAARDKCDYRYFLHLYLHSLFEVNPHAGKDCHDMQVELYADYDPKMLPTFLRSSQHYTLEKAYEVCVKKDLLKEQVFILGRMGNAKQALAVIINRLGDIEEAIEFVSMQQDDELWEELIKQSFHKPEMVGVLLEHTVGNLDPLYIVNMLPNDLEIPRLRDRLVKIVTDYRTETSLRHGCNDILKADCMNLLVKYYKEAKRGVCLSDVDDVSSCRGEKSASHLGERTMSMKAVEVKSKTRGGGRCCICFDPFSILNVSIIAFFCCHAFHTTCLMESTISIGGNKETGIAAQRTVSYDEYDNGVNDDYEGEDEEEDTSSGAPQMRCILCTTAAG